MSDEATPDLEAVRREARSLARKAVRVLGQVLQSGSAQPAQKVSAAMRILELAFGKSLEATPSDTGSTALDDLLRGLAKPEAPAPTQPKETEDADT